MARLERGAGLPAVERLAYWPELVSKQLDGLEHLILAGATAARTRPLPTAARTARWLPAGCAGARALAADVRRAHEPRGTWWRRSTPRTPSPCCKRPFVPPRPEGPLTAAKVCQAIGATLPEGAILSDEAITSASDLAGQHRGGSQARLAHPDRRRDRPGVAGRGRRGDRMPGPPGHRTRGRRLGSLHDPVALDDGARTARRHRRDLQQPCLRDPQRGVRPHRSAGRWSQSQGAARAWGIQTSTSSSSAPGSASRRVVSTPRNSSPAPSTRPSLIQARI